MPEQALTRPEAPIPGEAARVLLVEDDEGDAYLVEELLRDAEEGFALARARSVSEASVALRRGIVDCALVDLGLPDAQGLDALTAVLRAAPHVAVVVLTGWADKERGSAAVAAGAQDYLVKGEVDGPTLARSIRYAVQRRRADENARRLLLAERRQGENDRLARGLLPRPLIASPSLTWATRYQPGGPEALLGGDFFDAVELPDGTVRAMIGDVCGHGPDEAAVGVALRIAWRALVMSGMPAPEVLQSLDTLLRSERHSAELFATLCDVEVAPERDRVALRLHGHPAPMLLRPAPRLIDDVHPDLPLGLGDSPAAVATEVELAGPWALLLFTDGIYEGRRPEGGRVDIDDFVALVVDEVRREAEGGGRGPAGPEAILDRVVARSRALCGGALADDVALLWLGSEPGR